MGWNKINDKLYTGLPDGSKVSCSKGSELDYIQSVIKEEFPYLSDDDIEIAVIVCCDSVSPPRSREDFISCLKRSLENE